MDDDPIIFSTMNSNGSKQTDDDVWRPETLKWIKKNRLPPPFEKRNPSNMVSYVACLSCDLATGKDGYTGENLPCKLNEDQISIILQELEKLGFLGFASS